MEPIQRSVFSILCQDYDVPEKLILDHLNSGGWLDAARICAAHPGIKYSKLAARFVLEHIYEQAPESLDDYLAKLPIHIRYERIPHFTDDYDYAADKRFDYLGITTLLDRYLLRDENNRIFERPQYLFLRVACTLGTYAPEVHALYKDMSEFKYLHSTPTLFNAGTAHEQLSSCFLFDSPQDSIESGTDDIYSRAHQVARISKWAGGVGLSFSKIRERGSRISSTGGLSNGHVPFLKIYDATMAAVNQGGKRDGSAAVYQELWHPDILEFLELRDSNGVSDARTRHLHTVLWVRDEFMRRVEADEKWSLISPVKHPELTALAGAAWLAAYQAAEVDAVRTISARELYMTALRKTATTGHPWWTFADACNAKCNQVSDSHPWIVNSSNLCTEITEVTRPTQHPTPIPPDITVKELQDNRADLIDYMLNGRWPEDTRFLKKQNLLTPTEGQREWYRQYFSDHEPLWKAGMGWVAVCNLASLNLHAFVKDKQIDYQALKATTRRVVRALDRVIDLNFYPLPEAKQSNMIWRPIGLGLMGWWDALQEMQIDFDSPTATEIARSVQKAIYWAAVDESVSLAQEFGRYPAWAYSQTAQGKFSPDLWSLPVDDESILIRQRATYYGMRNSLLIAIAPTATIASILGVEPSTEAPMALAHIRKTASGDFLQISPHTQRILAEQGIWDDFHANWLSREGSIQTWSHVEPAVKKRLRTAFELSQRAIIEQAVARAPYIDQSASTNFFFRDPDLSKLSALYLAAWKAGLKTTYYLHTIAATRIGAVTGNTPVGGDTGAICSMEPGCESCQ